MNELKRQLDVKIGDTKGRAQNVMSKIEKNKRTQRPAKKSWIPYFTTVAVVALASFLLFLLYPQNEPNETADDPTIESPIVEEDSKALANYFSKSEETMYYAGGGNEYAAFQLTTTWLSENYVQQIIDNGGGITQQIYRIQMMKFNLFTMT